MKNKRIYDFIFFNFINFSKQSKKEQKKKALLKKKIFFGLVYHTSQKF